MRYDILLRTTMPHKVFVDTYAEEKNETYEGPWKWDYLLDANLVEFLAPSGRQRFTNYLDRMRQESTAEGLVRLATKDGEERIWMYHYILFRVVLQ